MSGRIKRVSGGGVRPRRYNYRRPAGANVNSDSGPFQRDRVVTVAPGRPKSPSRQRQRTPRRADRIASRSHVTPRSRIRFPDYPPRKVFPTDTSAANRLFRRQITVFLFVLFVSDPNRDPIKLTRTEVFFRAWLLSRYGVIQFLNEIKNELHFFFFF